jgi:hypothetical protein
VAVDSGGLPLTYAVTGGTLVPGVTLLANGSFVGVPTVPLPGQPTSVTSCVDPATASYTFTVTVSNGFVWAPRAFTITLEPPVLVTLQSTRIIAVGPASWSVPTGILPSQVEVLVVGGGGSGGTRHGIYAYKTCPWSQELVSSGLVERSFPGVCQCDLIPYFVCTPRSGMFVGTESELPWNQVSFFLTCTPQVAVVAPAVLCTTAPSPSLQVR